MQVHEEDETGQLLGDINHSNNGNDCFYESDECIPSSGIDKGKTNQVMKAKHNTKVRFVLLD